MYNHQSKEITDSDIANQKELFIYRALDIYENDYELLKEKLDDNYNFSYKELMEFYNIIDRIKKNRSVISVRRSNKLFHAVNNNMNIHEIITSLIEKGEI